MPVTIDAQPARDAVQRLRLQLDELAGRVRFRWRGKHGKGAVAARRAQKRAEAEERNARTPDGRRSTRVAR